jgi:7,8-didemethyl-8-hydroxy-5-deazariboflavin synthase CofG subunit
MGVRRITYSPSLTVPLTRACVNRCRYCGYRVEGDGLLPMDRIRAIVRQAHQEGISEILILSGEKSDLTPGVRRDLDALGMDSLVSWTVTVCDYLLGETLLPHVNVGTLDPLSLERIRDVSASMGLMIEGINPEVNRLIHPEKRLEERIETLESAGKLKIPFTTGILMGTGESQQDRLASIRLIERIHGAYGHLQEIILQRVVPHPPSRFVAHDITGPELEELIAFSRSLLPEVSIQIPPNLEPHWEDCLSSGANDLGGIGSGGDHVNPGSPWPELSLLAEHVAALRCRLVKRLPLYPGFYRAGWYSENVGKVLRYWIEDDDAYPGYS